MEKESVPFRLELSFFSLAVFLAPLQLIGIPAGSSRIDLSAIFAFALAISFFIKKPSWRHIIFLLIASLPTLFFLIADPERIPFYRIASTFVWLFSYSYLLCYRGFAVIAPLYLKRYILLVKASAFFGLCLFAFQALAQGYVRPSSSFGEPSTMGLFYGSLLAADLVATFQRNKLSPSFLLLGGSYLYLNIISQSATLLTSLLAIFIFFVYYLRFHLKQYMLQVFAVLSIAFLAIYFLITSSHLAARLGGVLNPSLSDPNISSLSWLAGFEQLKASVALYPLGAGMGGTGSFPFSGTATDLRLQLGLESLNLYDAYSLFFRISIEFGLIFLILFLFFLFRVYYKSFALLSRASSSREFPSKDEASVSWLIVFTLSLWLGLLLKEPMYGGSLLSLVVLGMPLLRFSSASSFIPSRPNHHYLS